MILSQERVFFDCAALLDAILKPYGEQDLPLSEIVRRGFEEMAVRQVGRMVKHAEYERRRSSRRQDHPARLWPRPALSPSARAIDPVRPTDSR